MVYSAHPSSTALLLQHSTFALGTVRPNRIGFPSNLSHQLSNLQRGDWVFLQQDKLVAYLFLDRNPVYFLSTFYYPTQTTTLDRRLRTGEQQTYSVPLAVQLQAYNSARSALNLQWIHWINCSPTTHLLERVGDGGLD
jgi:hypothetical protein